MINHNADQINRAIDLATERGAHVILMSSFRPSCRLLRALKHRTRGLLVHPWQETPISPSEPRRWFPLRPSDLVLEYPARG